VFSDWDTGALNQLRHVSLVKPEDGRFEVITDLSKMILKKQKNNQVA